MFLGQLSGVGTGLLPQHLPVFRLGFVCFINALRWRTSRLVSTSTGLMMEHEPPSKRRRSAEKKILKDESTIKGLDAGRESCLRDTSPPGTDLSRDFKSTHVTGTLKDQSECKDGGCVPHPHRGSEEESPRASSEEAVGGTPPPEIEPVVHHAQGWKSLLPRRWEVSPVGGAPRSPHVGGRRLDFSVMSYNILSQDLLRANGNLYSGCPPAALSWRHRLHNLLAELHHYDADVLCLQEVQEDHFENQIRPALHAQGYECVYKKRTRKNQDGCAVAFKTSRFSLLSSNPVEYFRPGDALLDRDNVGLILLLRPSGATADDFVCVANTHLLYNPRRGDIKLAQLAILLAEISRSARLSDGAAHPVLLCGDFNSTPWSPLFAFLTNGRLDYRHLPIGTVSGQENTSRGQRLLESPIWSPTLGINQRCQYESTSASSSSAAAAEQESSQLTAKEVTQRAVADKSRKRWRLEHGVPLRSCYPPYLPPDGRGAVTTCHLRCAMMVDYILYTPCESLPGGRGLQLLGRLSLVGQPELDRVDRLPNARHSSDHLPLLARFRWMVGERS